MNANSHTWHFSKAGGLDQVQLRTGEDIARLAALDLTLWAALSCPTKGLRFDAKTLELLDSDRDGRIRVPEVLAAIQWLSARLTSLDPLFAASESLSLSALNDASPDGAALLASAKRILSNLGKEGSASISLADVADTAKIFAQTRFNGDGIVPADAADDADTRQAIGEIIAVLGPEPDRSGKPGVGQAKVEAFFAAAEARLAWASRPAAEPALLPLGDATPAAAATLAAVRAKVDDYFTRCRLAAFDPRAAEPLCGATSEFSALAALPLSDSLPALDALPLSQVAARRDLPLLDGVNPRWIEPLAAFHAAVVAPLLGADRTSLSAAEWKSLNARFAPYEAWRAAEAGAEVAALSPARLTALAKGGAKAAITALIVRDATLEADNARIAEVEKLLRFSANLLGLLNNFVNMSRLYSPRSSAVFRVGTLYMDARACSLCFHVDDVASHAAQAAASKCCLAYCALKRPATGETRTICAAFTAGFAQSLWVGRNGVFYDLDGKDWDATLVKLVDNSISLKEAFWDPWRKIVAMVGDQVRKMLSAKHDAALAGAAKKIDAAAAAPSAEAPKKMEGAALASSVAALGIAVGMIGTAVGGLVSMLAGLPLWKSALGVPVVLLLVSGPSVILTWFKLRARDVAPILNACGWAINRRLRLTLILGKLFTREAELPLHAKRELADPYANDSRNRERLVVAIFLLVYAIALWSSGLLDSVMPRHLQRNTPAALEHAPAK